MAWVADTCLLIAFQGLLTRNEADFRNVYPALKILTP